MSGAVLSGDTKLYRTKMDSGDSSWNGKMLNCLTNLLQVYFPSYFLFQYILTHKKIKVERFRNELAYLRRVGVPIIGGGVVLDKNLKTCIRMKSVTQP